MALDKDKKIEVQQKIIEKLTSENEQLKNELYSAQKKSEDIKRENEQRMIDLQCSKEEFENIIKDFHEQKKLFDEQMKKVKSLLRTLSDEVKTNFN